MEELKVLHMSLRDSLLLDLEEDTSVPQQQKQLVVSTLLNIYLLEGVDVDKPACELTQDEVRRLMDLFPVINLVTSSNDLSSKGPA